jgi:hypothetical protein
MRVESRLGFLTGLVANNSMEFEGRSVFDKLTTKEILL